MAPMPGSVLFTVFLIEFIVIVTINAFTLIAFAKQHRLRRRTTYLIINLTVADLMVGAVSGPVNTFIPTEDLFNLRRFFFVIFCNLSPVASLTNLSLISLERLHATLYPFRHCLISEWVYFKIVIGSWLLALLLACVMGVLELYFQSYDTVTVSYAFLNLLVITVSYIILTAKVKSNPTPGTVASLRKMSVTLFIVCAVSILATMPGVISQFIDFLSPETAGKSEIMSETVSVLYWANSLVNPLIYAIRMQEFRKAIKDVICSNTQERRVVPN